MILARGGSSEEIEAVVGSDPLVAGGVATYELFQFEPGRRVKELDDLI